MRVAIAGDVLHSRVARSNVWLLRTLGAEVTLVAPPTLLPIGVEKWPCTVSYDLDETLARGVDAMMMLRVQGERMNASFFPTTREYSAAGASTTTGSVPWTAWASRTPSSCTPGPMNRGPGNFLRRGRLAPLHGAGAGPQRRLHPHGGPLPAALRGHPRTGRHHATPTSAETNSAHVTKESH